MASERDRLAAQANRAWIAAEEQQVRDVEDKAEYLKYAKSLREARVAPAERVEPLSFEVWRALMPPDEADPALRAAIATNRSSYQGLVTSWADTVANRKISDDFLTELGFDLRDRVTNPDVQLTETVIRAGFEEFAQGDSRFDRQTHFDAVSEFLLRNELFPCARNLHYAFSLLWNLALIAAKPEPEVKVNLTIQRDPEAEARGEAERKRAEYGTKIVAVGPDGIEYTQYQLDRLSADDYRIAVGMYGERYPRFSHVIQRF